MASPANQVLPNDDFIEVDFQDPSAGSSSHWIFISYSSPFGRLQKV
jgi:hypothetical protein